MPFPFDRAKFADDVLITGLHGSTHWDGFAHLIVGETMYNGFWGGSITAAAGAAYNGVHNQHESLVGRGILLDVCAEADGGEPLAPGHAVTAQMLDEVAAAQGVEGLRSGDLVFVRTGYLGSWYELEFGEHKTHGWWVNEPGLSLDTIPWLREHDVAAVACDNFGASKYSRRRTLLSAIRRFTMHRSSDWDSRSVSFLA